MLNAYKMLGLSELIARNKTSTRKAAKVRRWIPIFDFMSWFFSSPISAVLTK